ncbi:MAG: hypothetical protein ACYTGX_16570 [Planctomycetota bacterium]|jgi:hypothetical protein
MASWGRIAGGLTLAALLPAAAFAQSSKDKGEPRSIAIVPQNPVLEPGGRLVLEAFGNFDDDSNDRVRCRWRLLAQKGQARLARGKGPTVVAKVEAGVAPAFVVVEATHALADGVILRAQTTVLCSKPVLTAPARVAVGEAGPVEVTLPLLPPERESRVLVEVIETPDGPVDPKLLSDHKLPGKEPKRPQPTHGARFVRMDDGAFGPVGASYAVRMPMRGGSLQAGVTLPRPGRWVLRGAIILDAGRRERTYYTDPVVVHAYRLARIRVLSYAAGPPIGPGQETAGPSGHAVAGPVVLEPPQAVAPVVLGYGPGGEALGIMSRSTVRFGRVVEQRGRSILSRERLPMGMYYVDGGFPGRPPSGSVVPRAVMLHQFGAHALRNNGLTSYLVLAEPIPMAIVPLPVDSEMRLAISLHGTDDGCRTAPLKGRSAYLLTPKAGGPQPETIAKVEGVTEREARVVGLAPGLVRVRSRCALVDREGNSAALRLVTDVLVIGHDEIVWCDFFGRPVADPLAGGVDEVRFAVLGAGKALDSGKSVAPVFPAAAPFTGAGAMVKLEREGGWCWYVPVRRKKP